MVNSYKSPSGLCHIPVKPGRVRALLLCVVLFNVGWNAQKVIRHGPELTPVPLVIGALLWFVLPPLAAFLLWRGWKIGRWLLVGLFGLLVLADVVMLGMYLRIDPDPRFVLFVNPYRTAETLIYLALTAWLIFSPGIRSLCAQCPDRRVPKPSSTEDEEPK